MIVGILLISEAAGSFHLQGFPTVYPFIQDQFDLSRAQVGFVSSGMMVGGLATAFLTGWLVDILGVKRILMVAPVCLAVLVLVFPLSQSILIAVLVAFLAGAAAAGIHPANARGIVEWIRPQHRGVAMGIEQTSVPMCGIVAALALPSLAVAFSWRIAVMSMAFIIALAPLVVFAYYKDNPESSYPVGSRSNPLVSMRLVAKNRDIWIVSLCSITQISLQAVIVGYLILFLTEHLAISAVAAGVYLAVFQAAGVMWRIAWGLISDILLHGRRVAGLGLMYFLSVMSMSLMVWLPSDAQPLLVGAVVFLVSGSFMGCVSLHPILLADLGGPGRVGTVIGFAGIIGRLGSFGIPPLFGYVVDRTGNYDTGWWMMAGVAAAGALLLTLLRPQARRL